MSIQTISSFPPISNQQKFQTIHNPKISVLAAFNKLKQTQSKIVQVNNKEAVQRRINQAIKAREYERQQSSAYKQSIRKSIQMDKTMREKSLQQRIREQTKLHQLASTLRNTRQNFRQTIKSAFKQTSSQVYSQALSQRQKNEELIREFKEKEMLLKQEKRLRMAENLQKSREKVRNFKQSRVGFIKRQREKDVQELQRKIMARSRYLQRLGENDKKGNESIRDENSQSRYSNDKRSQSFTLNGSIDDSKSRWQNCQQQEISLVKKRQCV